MRFLKGFNLPKTFAARPTPKLKFHSQPHKPPSANPNRILKEYLNNNSPTRALTLLGQLLRKNTSSIDSYSLLYVIKACTQNSLASEGKQIHALVIKLGYEPIVYLQTTLISMYCKMADVGDAHRMFDEIPNKNVFCWTALLSAYVDNQKSYKALQLFRQMQLENVEPDHFTLTVALSACADLGALELGEWIHDYIHRSKGLSQDLYLMNSLINMYAKCGYIEIAKQLFDGMKKKDVTTWTSIIVGHAIHGQAEEALGLFGDMKEENKRRMAKKKKYKSILPNDVTFIGVLMACSHAGMVEEGERHFKSMINDYGIKPRYAHFGCMVDLFCRAGLLYKALDYISAMPIKPNAVLWRTLLGACSIHGNMNLAAEVHCKLLELEENLVGDNVVMSNIYAAKGQWDEKLRVRDEIKQRRAPGCSSIEVGNSLCEFRSADDHHPFKTEIYIVLEQLIENMKAYDHEIELSGASSHLI